ncbi:MULTISPECIES: hypothetical protein [unclassified Streptosporangium]|uniref:hypothetical protein n=1 Tax=unclassified Streptosporangium TaxID=2632669 RepID=UPI002E2877E7|nr:MULTISPECIES: hypothetical protein [unclassified Streptosporangium]
MAGFVTVLQTGDTLSAAGHFAGPWRDFRRVRIEPGASETVVGDTVEAAIFVMSGAVSVRVGDTDTPVEEGGALAVGLGSRVDLVARENGAELFITTLNVDLG